MSATVPTAMPGATPASQSSLPARIRWLCYLIRIAALLWAGWILVNVVRAWYVADPAKFMENLSRGLDADVSEISRAQIAAFFTGNLGLWAFDAAIAYCVWRLTGSYLAGRIFTVEAAVWMRRIGVTGLIAVLSIVAWRWANLFIFTIHAHVPAAKVLLFGQLVTPTDLMRLLFCLFLIALAHIFKAAAELADDHAGIV
jgi:Protein of unknown function (DUF2975)